MWTPSLAQPRGQSVKNKKSASEKYTTLCDYWRDLALEDKGEIGITYLDFVSSTATENVSKVSI